VLLYYVALTPWPLESRPEAGGGGTDAKF
jgi:hypothetical protein